MDLETVRPILFSIILGLMVGIQRSVTFKKAHQEYFAGGRTFALISLLGAVSAWLQTKSQWIILAVFMSISLLLLISYYLKVVQKNRWGMTTQIAALLTFLIGVVSQLIDPKYAILLTVLLIAILEFKPKLQLLESHIGRNDLNAATLLLVMSFVVLPFLPDWAIDPWHLFNPYKTWLMAVIIAGISFVGYVAIRAFGQKHGIFLTGAAGGFISSTAVSITLSKMFNNNLKLINNYAGGIAIASTFMYIRVLFEILVIYPNLALKLSFAYGMATLSGLLIGWYLYKHSKDEQIDLQNSTLYKNPLQLSEAIKFGLLFGLIYGAITIVKGRYGDIGVYAVSVVSGLSDVDAITLSLSQMAKEATISISTSSYAIALASVTNSFVKLGIVFVLAGKRLGMKLTYFYLITLGFLSLGLFLSEMI